MARPKTPKKPKTKPDAPGAPALGHNSRGSRLTDAEERELFSKHRQTWKHLQSQQKILDEKLASAKGALKADGFQVQHMHIADDLANPKGEKKVHAHVRDRLWVARMIGHAMGRQLDLFDQPDRTPAVDRSYEEGRQTSIDNQPCRCEYEPHSEQYRSFMKGYGDHQSELMGRGFKKSEEEPIAGERVTREEFHRRIKGDAAEADKMIKDFPGDAP